MVNITVPSHLMYCYAGSIYPDSSSQIGSVFRFFITLDGSREEHNLSAFKQRRHDINENDVSHCSADGSLSVSGGEYCTRTGQSVESRLGAYSYMNIDYLVGPANMSQTSFYVATSFRSGNTIFYGWYSVNYDSKYKYWKVAQQGIPGAVIIDDTFSFAENRVKMSGVTLIPGYFSTYATADEAISAAKGASAHMALFGTPKVNTSRIIFALRDRTSTWSVSRLPNPNTRFQFNEPGHIFSGRPWRRSECVMTCKSHAFWNAADGIKVLNDNFLATLIEAIQFLLKLKSGKFSFRESLPSSLYDAWLCYRYQYLTTKADFEEGVAFIKWTGMFDLSQNYKTHGKYFDEESGVTCYCTLTVRNKAVDACLKAWSTLRTYGVQPNFYLVWDSLPFSFIVDWFIPVGDLVTIIDKQNYLSDTFDCVSCVYSLRYDEPHQYLNGEVVYHIYSRWLERRFPALEFQYLYDGGSTSDKTFIFRCLDAVSLILGRK